MKKSTILLMLILVSASLFAQDKIIGYDNSIINAKITEISDSLIIYKAWDNLDGPIYTTSKMNVAVILFQNGKVEVIKVKPKTFAEIRDELKAERRQNINYRNSFGFDAFSLVPGMSAFTILDGSLSSFGFSFERRNKKQFMGHKLSFYLQYVGDTKGSFYVAYQPKFFFNKHKIIRGFSGLEAGVGLYHSSYYYDYNNYNQVYKNFNDLRVHIAPVVGLNIYPTEKMYMVFDYAMGGQMMTIHQEIDTNFPFFWRIGFTLGVNF